MVTKKLPSAAGASFNCRLTEAFCLSIDPLWRSSDSACCAKSIHGKKMAIPLKSIHHPPI